MELEPHEKVPNTDIEREGELIAYPLQAPSASVSAERWMTIKDIVTHPLMYFGRNAQFLAMAYDQILSDGVPLDVSSVATHLSQIHSETARTTLRRFKVHEDAGTLVTMNQQARGKIAGPWITSECQGDSVLDMIGGYATLHDLDKVFVTSASIKNTCKYIKELYDKRRSIKIFQSAIETLSRPDAVAESISGDVINKLSSFGNEKTRLLDAGSVIDELILAEEGDNPPVAFWPIDELNRVAPICAGQLITLGGLPGAGKTSMATQIVSETAKTAERGSIMYITIEMSPRQLMSVVVGQRMQTPAKKIAKGGHDEITKEILENLTKDFRTDNPLNIIDGAVVKHTDVAQFARLGNIRSQSGLKLLIVDHLHLLSQQYPQQQTLEHLSQCTLALKLLAKEMGIAVVLLAQLNRSSQNSGHEKDGRVKPQLEPRMSDFKGSGTIEADSDAMVCLWKRDDGDSPVSHVTACVLKNRAGSTLQVETTFHKANGQYFSAGWRGDDPEDVYDLS